MPRNTVRAPPPETGGVPVAAPTRNACRIFGVKPVFHTIFNTVAVGTVKQEGVRPGTPPIPSIAPYLNGLVLPATPISLEDDEGRGGLLDYATPGFHPWEWEGASFNRAFIRSSLD